MIMFKFDDKLGSKSVLIIKVHKFVSIFQSLPLYF